MNLLIFPKTAAEPGASEKPCGHLGRLLGALGWVLNPLDRFLGSLEASWGLLERSWRPLRASWGAPAGFLGPLGRLLGRLRGDPNVTKITCQKQVNFQTPKHRVDLRYGAPFGRPKSTKIASKTSQNLRRFSRAKKLRFKSLLEPSWADLGAFWVPSWGPKCALPYTRASVW